MGLVEPSTQVNCSKPLPKYSSRTSTNPVHTQIQVGIHMAAPIPYRCKHKCQHIPKTFDTRWRSHACDSERPVLGRHWLARTEPPHLSNGPIGAPKVYCDLPYPNCGVRRRVLDGAEDFLYRLWGGGINTPF